MNALAAMFAGWRTHFSSADPRGTGTHSPNTTSKEGICTWLGENSAGFSIQSEPPLYIKKDNHPQFPRWNAKPEWKPQWALQMAHYIPSNVLSSSTHTACVLAKLLRSCPTLWDPMGCVAHQAPLSMGFSRQKYWSGLPCFPPGDLSNPGIKPVSLVSCIGRWVFFFYH